MPSLKICKRIRSYEFLKKPSFFQPSTWIYEANTPTLPCVVTCSIARIFWAAITAVGVITVAQTPITSLTLLWHLRIIPYKHTELPLDSEAIIKLLIEVHGYEIFVNGSFNGDPHAGNILVLPDGRLGLIDYGQVSNFLLFVFRCHTPCWRFELPTCISAEMYRVASISWCINDTVWLC